MNDLRTFLDYLNSLTPSQLQPLFDLLPDIEGKGTFSDLGTIQIIDNINIVTTDDFHDVVNKFLRIVDELKLIPVFDWGAWQEGKELLNAQIPNVATLDLLTLCKLFTLVIRADRFSEGFLILNFENGNITRIIKAIKNNKMK
jgi:hypothetical protein